MDLKIDVLTADTSPLIHLASCGLLHSLTKAARFVIADVVEIEATREGKPFAEEISAWIDSGKKDGSVIIEKTTTGETLKLALKANPDYRQKDGGELAILDWLLNKIRACDDHAMVIYENGKVPSMIQNWDMDANITILTTKAFLFYCKKEDLIKDAESAWEHMIEKYITMNSRHQTTLIRRG